MGDSYPGQHTEFHIVVNGVQTGPIVGLVELFRYKINPDTPVWYEGLEEWTPAMMAELTRQLFVPGSLFYRAHPEALAIMNGRLTGADPDTLPTLRDDNADEPVAEPESPETAEPEPVNPGVEEIHSATPAQSAWAQPMQPTATAQPTPCPSSYLVLSIIVTVLFCLITGLVAVIYSIKVKSKYRAGNLAGAAKCSELAQTWIAISIVVGLIVFVGSMMIGPFVP